MTPKINRRQLGKLVLAGTAAAAGLTLPQGQNSGRQGLLGSALAQPQLPEPNALVISGSEFKLYGKPFYHFGANSDQLLYRSQADATNDLGIMEEAGIKQVRILVPNTNFTKEEIGDRLQWLLDTAYTQHHIRLSLVLTESYGRRCIAAEGRGGFYLPPGDEAAVYRSLPYGSNDKGLYTDYWFDKGYLTYYLPFVEYIVKRFRGHHGVFAFVIGRQLSNPPVGAVDPAVPLQHFLNFYADVSQRIRSYAPEHLIGAGIKHTRHCLLSSVAGKREQFYQNPNIDFVGVDLYNFEGELMGNRNDPYGPYRDIFDRDLATQFAKPYVITEVGFAQRRAECTVQPSYELADEPMQTFCASAYDFYGASAMLPWGWQFGNQTTADPCYGVGLWFDSMTMLARGTAVMLNSRNGIKPVAGYFIRPVFNSAGQVAIMRRVVAHGDRLWANETSDLGAQQWTGQWGINVLSSVWGSQANHPPTYWLDAAHIHYRFLSSSQINGMRQVFVKDGFYWYRDSNDIYGSSWGAWQMTTLAALWGSTTNHPPVDRIDSIFTRRPPAWTRRRSTSATTPPAR